MDRMTCEQSVIDVVGKNDLRTLEECFSKSA